VRKRVLVSQRRDAVAGRDEVRDSLDVRLSALLWELGFLPMPMASAIGDLGEYLEALMPDAVVLGGGNDIGQAPERDRLERALLVHAAEHRLPVLGICRGLQMINHHQGGTLRSVSGHVAGRHRVTGPLVGPDGREVNSYHNLGLLDTGLGYDLQAVAWSDDGVVEALRHAKWPWLGIMWHPERDSPVADADQRLGVGVAPLDRTDYCSVKGVRNGTKKRGVCARISSTDGGVGSSWAQAQRVSQGVWLSRHQHLCMGSPSECG
jgi:putative glutamine amidotransferase